MQKGDETKRRLVEAMATLLEERGYAATGLSDILARAEAPRGSFYFHFPEGKAQLAGAALLWAGENVGAALQTAVGSATSVKEGLEAVGSVLSARMIEGDFVRGCPLAATTLEMAGSSESLRHTVDAVYDSWVEGLAAFLRRLGWTKRRARSDATMIFTCLEGAILLCRAKRDVTPLDTVTRQLSMTLHHRRRN